MTRRSPATPDSRASCAGARTAVRTALALDSIVIRRAGAEHLAHRAGREPATEIH